MSLKRGLKFQKIFTAFLICGAFLFTAGIILSPKSALAVHSTSTYGKEFNGTLTYKDWNGLLYADDGSTIFGDFVNTWLPAQMNGPLGIATSSPTDAGVMLDVNGAIRSLGFLGPLTGTINAANVSSGPFGQNTFGGNYSFPASLGVGIESPAQTLHVHGAAGLPASSGVDQNGLFRLTNSTNDLALDFGQMSVSPWTSWIQNTNKTDLSQSYPIALNPNGGNVGIGTVSPAARLHIVGNLYVTGSNSTVGTLQGGTIAAGYSTAPAIITSQTTNENLQIYANGTGNILLQQNGGFVGIGTTSPTSTLHIAGGTGRTLYMGGGRIGGLNSTPYASDEAVPLGYLEANYTSSSTIHNVASSSWLLNGNTEGAIKTLGTKDAFDLPIITSSTERMRITSDGKVGIGTTSPSSKLDAFGNQSGAIIRARNIGGTGPEIAVAGHTIEAGGALDTAGYLGGYTAGGSGWWGVKGTTRTGSAIFGSVLNSGSGWAGYFDSKVYVAGNLGIGTTNPTAMLNIVGTSSTAVAMLKIQGSTGNYRTDIGTNDFTSYGFPTSNINLNFGFDTSNSAAWTGSGGSITFNTRDTGGAYGERMRIDRSGNVGIGTTAPTSTLHIAGGTGRTLYMGGGRIGGLDLTPLYTDEAVPLGYLQANYTSSSTIQSVASSSWLLDGNVVGSIKKLGTKDAYDLPIITSNVERMRITSGGNVGIGTTNPLAKLDVSGALKLGDTTDACDANHSGVFRYNPTSRQSYVCDGTRWLNQKNCGLMTDDAGQTYGTVQIGGQCWMAENINIGTMLASGATEPNTGDQVIEKWCYNNDTANCTLYGGLYNWYEATRGSQVSGARGICPAGWHIPTDAEYNILEKTMVGIVASPNPQYVCDFNTTNTNWYWRRCADDNGADSGLPNGAGKSLKAIGQGNGDDLAGFGGKLSGYRNTDGSYNYLGGLLYLWSSTPYGASYAWYRDLFSSYATVYRSRNSRALGFSVRCLKD